MLMMSSVTELSFSVNEIPQCVRVELPLLASTTEKALAVFNGDFGRNNDQNKVIQDQRGLERLALSLSRGADTIDLNFRSHYYDKPLIAEKEERSGILLRFKRKKRLLNTEAVSASETQGKLLFPLSKTSVNNPRHSVDVIGFAPTCYTFKSPFDYQFLPLSEKNDAMEKLSLDVLETVPMEFSRRQIERAARSIFSDTGKGLKTYLDERKERLAKKYYKSAENSDVDSSSKVQEGSAISINQEVDNIPIDAVASQPSSDNEASQNKGEAVDAANQDIDDEEEGENGYMLSNMDEQPLPLDDIVIASKNDSMDPNAKRREHYKMHYLTSCIRYGEEIPTGFPQSDVLPVRHREKDRYDNTYELLTRLFTYQPIWNRRSLLQHRILNKYQNSMKVTLPKVAYCYTSGPYARYWIRYGYNPSLDPYSKIFSTVAVRIRKHDSIYLLQTRIANHIGPCVVGLTGKIVVNLDDLRVYILKDEIKNRNSATSSDNLANVEISIYDNFVRLQMAVELSSIRDSDLFELICSQKIQSVCTDDYGWLSGKLVVSLRAMIKRRIIERLESFLSLSRDTITKHMIFSTALSVASAVQERNAIIEEFVALPYMDRYNKTRDTSDTVKTTNESIDGENPTDQNNNINKFDAEILSTYRHYFYWLDKYDRCMSSESLTADELLHDMVVSKSVRRSDGDAVASEDGDNVDEMTSPKKRKRKKKSDAKTSQDSDEVAPKKRSNTRKKAKVDNIPQSVDMESNPTTSGYSEPSDADDFDVEMNRLLSVNNLDSYILQSTDHQSSQQIGSLRASDTRSSLLPDSSSATIQAWKSSVQGFDVFDSRNDDEYNDSNDEDLVYEDNADSSDEEYD